MYYADMASSKPSVRQSVSLPSRVVRRVQALAKRQRTSASRVIVAVPVGAAEADIYCLWGEPLAMNVAKSIQAMPGPDAWISAQFELEAMARSARNAGDWQLAGFLAQQMILHNLNYAGGHYAYGLAAEHAGNAAEARQALAAAEKLWGKADRDLPELQQIHKQLAAGR